MLAFGGEAFAGAYRSSAPAGIVDIAPTVLDLMGLAIPPSMTGRALRDAYAAAPQDSAPVREQIYETGTGHYTQRVRVYEQGSHRYIDGGWLD